jgi:hypothetical protein
MTKNDVKCAHEIKPRIAMAKAAFNNTKKKLLTRKVDFNLKHILDASTKP